MYRLRGLQQKKLYIIVHIANKHGIPSILLSHDAYHRNKKDTSLLGVINFVYI